MEKEFYKEDWFTWVILILLPPAGIYLIWYFKKFNMMARIIATILFGMVTIAFLENLSDISNVQLPNYLAVLLVFALICVLVNYAPELAHNSFKTKSDKNIIFKTWNYSVCEKGDSLFICKNQFFKSIDDITPIEIKSINDIKIYEDDKEKSAVGKAVIGGLTFGTVGAIVGSSMKKQVVKKAGVKAYTDSGVFDFKVIHGETKKDGFVYNSSVKEIDTIYNTLIKYVKKH